MEINGDNHSRFGEMIVKYGIPERPEKPSSHKNSHIKLKPFIKVKPEMLSQNDDEVVIKYGIPMPPQNDNYKPQNDKNNDVVLKYAIPSQPIQISDENTSFLKKFLDKLLKK